MTHDVSENRPPCIDLSADGMLLHDKGTNQRN